MNINVKNKVTLSGMKPETANAIRQRLTIPNPAFAKAQRMGRSTRRIPRYLKFYKETAAGLESPRGAAQMICDEYSNCPEENITVVHNTRTLPPVSFDYVLRLPPWQAHAANGCLQQPMGLLVSPGGSDLIYMALYIIEQRKQPTLIVVNTIELMQKWIAFIEAFLRTEDGELGTIRGGKVRLGTKITVGLAQTIQKRATEVLPHIGHLIVDECHKAPAMQLIKAIEHFDCHYQLGLAETIYRRDGLDQVIQWYIGPVFAQIHKQCQLDKSPRCEGKADFFSIGDIAKP
jgi:superfamily II DNA or RNA helicase